MKITLVTFFLVGLFAIHAACEETTLIRFAHEVPDAPNVDVYVNGILTWPRVAFRNVTRYEEFQGNSAEIKITVAGTTTAVLNTQVHLRQIPITVSAVSMC